MLKKRGISRPGKLSINNVKKKMPPQAVHTPRNHIRRVLLNSARTHVYNIIDHFWSLGFFNIIWTHFLTIFKLTL